MSATCRQTIQVIETTLPRRVTARYFEESLKKWDALGGAPIWVLDASSSTSYDPDAVAVASRGLALRGQKGLRRVVAVTTNALIRMSGHAIGVTLRAAGVDFEVVASREDAYLRVAQPA